MTSRDISERYNLSQETIRWRTNQVGLRTQKGKRKYYTEDEVEKVVNYQRKNYSNFRFKNKNKIDIIETYLKDTNNSMLKIAERLNLKHAYVNTVVNEWFENDKTITVMSKL